MTTIFKSSNSHTGANDLETAAAFGYSRYVTRVLADGGMIIDPDACQAAFTLLVSVGLSCLQFVVGASFGVKMHAGRVEKLYSFNGNDMIATGGINIDGPFFDGSGTYPTIRIDGIATGAQYFVSQKALPLQAISASGFGMAVCCKSDGADSSPFAFQAYSDGSLNYAQAALNAYSNENGLNNFQVVAAKSTFSTAGQNAGQIETVDGGVYGDYKGFAAFINTRDNQMNSYLDGTPVVSNHNVTLYDFKSIPLRVVLSGYYAGVNGIVNYTKQNFTEAWIVNSCNAPFVAALSQRLADLY